jgi:uncharacterized protein with von Willebrand factor type A (vWA) domain
MLSSGKLVVFFSDGWDLGEPERLGEEMKRLRRHAWRVLWINPLKGRNGYAPLCVGMAAALPFVDFFLPGNTWEDLTRSALTLLGESQRLRINS